MSGRGKVSSATSSLDHVGTAWHVMRILRQPCVPLRRKVSATDAGKSGDLPNLAASAYPALLLDKLRPAAGVMGRLAVM